MFHYTPSRSLSTTKNQRVNGAKNDPYLSKIPPKDYSICKICRAIYHNKHWTLDLKLAEAFMAGKNPSYTTCPGCQKIKDHFPSGILSLEGLFLKNHKEEILHRIKNEEKKAVGFNPLSRIIEINDKNGKVEITTTNEKLAQRIGKSLKRAYKGDLVFKWSGNNKFMRVEWHRE